MDMVVLRIDNLFMDKVIVVLISKRMRGCLTLDRKRRISILGLLALGMVRNMRVGVWSVEMVAMDWVRVVT